MNIGFLNELLNSIAGQGRSLVDRALGLTGGVKTLDRMSLPDLARLLLSSRGEASGVAIAREITLEQCRASGHVLFLVTGGRFETVTLGHLGELFAGIVWENGAVLAQTASGETYLPFGQLDPPAQGHGRRGNST